MFDPAQLAALAAVHRRGAFDLAAADLGVTPSAISQRIKALEEATGTLLIRRGQPCEATVTGLRLVRHHEEISLLHQSLAAELRLTSGPAVTRIALNADSLATWVMPALASVEGLLFDVVIDDQDHSQELLKSGEVVGAITSHPGPLQGCDTIPLGALHYLATCAPEFAARWFATVDAASLSRAPALRFNDKDRLQEAWVAAQTGRRLALQCHRIASSQGFVDACLSGLGWGMNPVQLVRAHLASGALVELIPHTGLRVPLYWQFNRLTAEALAPLTRALRREARSLQT
ncbi:LysR family transcriptional regulator ArgP [Stagnihabitans tardus]|uniref:ArgP/LysG family DNA-binding transcriptional regulator n=1 Tax=Stagnihabitans tardus TaxID=2699202 RepID=A0AAE5BSQ0_9RHOB|nr:LysR family transcriptional regulator ArgP [Stagnihabitans tardus]NBZ88130.1 ArgP/LysG family DNA-binding transcriptional regulator [Stagnihabitans tardus]